MNTTETFRESATSAQSILDTLVAAGERQARISQIPPLMELQTICREAGCDFADLNAFARVRDQRPVLLLCGGDAEVAQELAKQIGIRATLPELPDAPLAWVVDIGARARLALRRGEGDKAITKKMLSTFLASELKLDDFVFIEEQVPGDSTWRFIWVPHPQYLAGLQEKPSAFEIVTAQQACVMISEDAPEPLTTLIPSLEQRHWSIPRDHWSQEETRAALLTEVAALRDEPDEVRELRAVHLWNYLAVRLLDQIQRMKQRYQSQIEQHGLKLQSLRHTLNQHHRNWSNGVQSVVDSHFKARIAGKSFASFYDIRQPGPTVQTYIAAAGFPALFTKAEQFAQDRMGDFAGGLDAMAVRMELHRITFGEMNTRWTPRSLGPKIESRLTERDVFQSGSEKPGGLIAKVTGKASAILERRKAEISLANREVTRVINADFADWCTDLITVFEQNVRVQLSAALVNQGLPDVEQLRSSLDGFDRLADRIRHYRESGRTAETVAADWLRQLAGRRWIPLYKRR